MDIKKLISFNNGSNFKTCILEVPKYCPHCGQTIIPHLIGNPITENLERDDDIRASQMMRCTDADCFKFFCTEYNIVPRDTISYTGKVIQYTYSPEVTVELPQELNDISPAFVEIYKQSVTAGVKNLSQLEGIGLRKSIEFLIKDYLINLKDKDRDDIEKKPLMQCIKLIDFAPLKDLSTAATWIGNDETHYVRKHTDKDINDMKTFIRSATLFISAEYAAIKASEFIDEA